MAYNSQGYGSSTLAAAAGNYGASQQSGLEAAIASAATALQSEGNGNSYLHRSYEVFRQHQYVSSQMSSAHQSGYTSTTAAAAESTAKINSPGSHESTAIYHSQPALFLNPNRPKTRFIAGAAELSEFIKEAFAKMMQKELPEDIAITVAARGILQQLHKQFFNEGVVGLSLNGSNREVFAIAGNLDEVMLVIGHELGHVLTPTLNNGQAEEAKAFAFEMAWAQTIFADDIAGLRNSINQTALSMKPAQNGMHDLAFAFVKAATVMAGKEPLTLHSEIAARQDFNIDFESEFQATAATAAAAAPVSYVPLSSTPHRASYHSGGYRNKSNVQNVPWFNNFSWADLGTGIYGMYIPLTALIFMNDRLLRTDLEQFHKTLGHEYILHHVMQLPDNYVTKILEDTIFWVKDEEDKYKP